MDFQILRHSRRSRAQIAGASLCAIATALCSPALAQVEEIIVTARKTAENLQSTPVTVSAFTEQGLKNRGITNNAEIGQFTPNVVFDTSSTFAGVDTFQAFIRGVGQTDFALNTDPGVGLYIDGVYFSRAPGAVVNLLDVERVEVLKGPQGTLFGRNSIGGAVSIVTRDPGDEFSAAGEATFGQRQRYEVSGVVSGPIVEGVLSGSVAFSVDTRDGYQERIPFSGGLALGGPSTAVIPTSVPLDQLLVTGDSSGRDPGAKSGGTIRAKLRWTPAENFDFVLSGDTTARRDAANPTTLLEVDPNFALGGLYNACVAGIPGLPCLSPFLPTGANAGGTRPDLQYTPQFITGDIDTTFATGANFANIDQYGFAGTATWRASDNLIVKSITAYRELDSAFGLDIDSSPLVFDQTSFTLNTEQFSQELQFNLDFGRFNATAGGFFLDEDGDQLDNVPIAGGLIQVAGGFEHDTRSWALFGEGNFDLIPDTLSVLFGIRYSEDTKNLVLNQQNLNTDFSTLGINPALLPRPGSPQFLGPATPLSETFTNTSIRAGVNWQVTDDLYTYFTFSQGYKSGGFTTRLTTFFSDALIALANPADPAVLRQLDFGEETSDNYEFGFKSRLFGNRVRLNGAMFRNTYDNIQIVVQRGVSPSNENIAKARIQGFELELEAVPNDFLTVAATLGYLDAKYIEIDPAVAPLLVNRFGLMLTTNTPLQNTPEWTASGSINAAFTESLSGNFNVSYTSRVENEVFALPVLSQEGYALLGASLDWSPSEQWNLKIGVTNLTDERYIVSGFEAGALPFTIGSYNRPREWFVTLGYRF